MFEMNRRKWSLILALLLVLTAPTVVSAATLVVDGLFDDWVGRDHVDDPAGDSQNPNTDIRAFYWGDNPNDEHIYWMMERENSNAPVYYVVYLDTNNEGDYGDAEDRMVGVRYQPTVHGSQVTVVVLTGTGSLISYSSGDWGESKREGGRRAEWRASFADLGIDAYQTVSMYAVAAQSSTLPHVDRVPDEGAITWTPIPILGWPWLAAIVVVAVAVVWYRRRRVEWQRS